jgi:hypothetical protein
VTGQRASCPCGQFSATAAGEPVRISVCHCLNCKKRSGSAFAAQVRFPADQVGVVGRFNVSTRFPDSGNAADFHFCPDCGTRVLYVNQTLPDTIAIPLGAFDDPFYYRPLLSIYEERRNDWAAVVGDGIEHFD